MGGVSLHLVSKVLGHKDTRMVERVYGQLPPEALRRALALHLEGHSDEEGATKYSPNFGEMDGFNGHLGPPVPPQQAQESGKPEKTRGTRDRRSRRDRAAGAHGGS